MSRRFRPLARLEGHQIPASSPRDHAAVSASAGTGKTQVLTSRVLRLLLAGADPSSILCLTFTKAGAAEMAQRLHERLSTWVRLDSTKLRKELNALSENRSQDIERARTLFARVLEATGGGLRIQTIHAFAQGLLAAFPSEAGLAPGFRPLEQREQKLLVRSTLAALLVQAEEEGDSGLVRDIQRLSLRLGEGGAEKILEACARAPDAMTSLGPREGIEARLRQAFDLPLGDVEEAVARECDDFDAASLGRIAELNREWGRPSGLDRASVCEQWLDAAPAERMKMLDTLHLVWATRDGEARAPGPRSDEYAELSAAAFECCARLIRMRDAARLVSELAAGLRAGQAFARAYAGAKRAAGVADFDDLIRWTVQLLQTPGVGEWVRYKLDQRIDHLLVDEAQDTNRSQWTIVGRLVEEFFAGEGSGSTVRTVFAVGDFKQAIFGFQGTNPRAFEEAVGEFEELALPLRRLAEESSADGRWPRERPLPPDFLRLSIDRNYRSAPAILEVVDKVLEGLGPGELGLPSAANPHLAYHEKRGGSVTLWPPFAEDGEEEGEEGWISDRVRGLADQLARQVRAWLDRPFHLECRGRPLRPEDILILVRSRGELASLLVARLHQQGVPVAGVDRLMLSAPLAVQDLLAAARFAVQPLDDLNLASLLVSPLLGWDQDRLLAVAAGRKRARLWPHLRGHDGTPAETLEALHSILAMADFATPHAFFEYLLSGPLDGRRRLMERLGTEARDPIEELLSSALDYENGQAGSLQAFLDWFARGDVEIVRDPSAPLDAVRVMTVHGSKGLQSPVLVLADACFNPDRKGGVGPGIVTLPTEAGGVPLFRPRKRELVEPLTALVAEQDRLDREEHWRLLYVALTRAEERLFVGGALGSRDRAPADASWHRAVERALEELGAETLESELWGEERRHGSPEKPGTKQDAGTERIPTAPDWLRRPAATEERPPRPLAPSSIGEDDTPYPPPSPGQREAAERGRLLHQLFERLPGADPARRSELARRWLERSAGIEDALVRDALAEDACAVVADPRFSDLFGPDSLAEAPIAAVLPGGIVVSGTVDRLLVTDERILVADFKTGRTVPAGAADIPAGHLRQMAAYRDALRVVFPGRPVEAALLYTAGPVLHLIDDSRLDAHAPQPA